MARFGGVTIVFTVALTLALVLEFAPFYVSARSGGRGGGHSSGGGGRSSGGGHSSSGGSSRGGSSGGSSGGRSSSGGSSSRGSSSSGSRVPSSSSYSRGSAASSGYSSGSSRSYTGGSVVVSSSRLGSYSSSGGIYASPYVGSSSYVMSRSLVSYPSLLTMRSRPSYSYRTSYYFGRPFVYSQPSVNYYGTAGNIAPSAPPTPTNPTSTQVVFANLAEHCGNSSVYGIDAGERYIVFASAPDVPISSTSNPPSDTSSESPSQSSSLPGSIPTFLYPSSSPSDLSTDSSTYYTDTTDSTTTTTTTTISNSSNGPPFLFGEMTTSVIADGDSGTADSNVIYIDDCFFRLAGPPNSILRVKFDSPNCDMWPSGCLVSISDGDTDASQTTDQDPLLLVSSSTPLSCAMEVISSVYVITVNITSCDQDDDTDKLTKFDFALIVDVIPGNNGARLAPRDYFSVIIFSLLIYLKAFLPVNY